MEQRNSLNWPEMKIADTAHGTAILGGPGLEMAFFLTDLHLHSVLYMFFQAFFKFPSKCFSNKRVH